MPVLGTQTAVLRPPGAAAIPLSDDDIAACRYRAVASRQPARLSGRRREGGERPPPVLRPAIAPVLLEEADDEGRIVGGIVDAAQMRDGAAVDRTPRPRGMGPSDRKSTRLNSSH